MNYPTLLDFKWKNNYENKNFYLNFHLGIYPLYRM